MRLLRPNPGECVDRQTILRLKMYYGQQQGKNIQGFVNENEEIQRYLEKEFLLLAPKSIQHDYDTLFNEIGKVNKELWLLEDKCRALLPRWTAPGVPSVEFLTEIANTTLAVPVLNDRRASLVLKMNALFGIETQEKVYAVQA